jgi:hypothetical protein
MSTNGAGVSALVVLWRMIAMVSRAVKVLEIRDEFMNRLRCSMS